MKPPRLIWISRGSGICRQRRTLGQSSYTDGLLGVVNLANGVFDHDVILDLEDLGHTLGDPFAQHADVDLAQIDLRVSKGRTCVEVDVDYALSCRSDPGTWSS